MHENEIYFQHLFTLLDGDSSSPDTYTGRIGQPITEKNGLKLDLESHDFEKVEGDVPILEDWDDSSMNNDLKYFYHMANAVQNGTITPELLKRKTPKVTTNRWVNTASSILRLYVQTEPAELESWPELKRLVKIILNIYGPLCFLTRIHWKCTNGSWLYWEVLKRAKIHLNQHELEDFMKNFQNNNFWGHPEAILLCALADESEEVRMWALDMLKKAKENETKMATDRRKKFPFRKWVMMSNSGFFNENADHYTKLVHWDELPGKFFGVPPLLSDYSLEELESFAANGSLDIQIPCHAQSVERMVGITSRSALIAVGQEARHAWILNSQEATKALPISKGFIPKSMFRKK